MSTSEPSNNLPPVPRYGEYAPVQTPPATTPYQPYGTGQNYYAGDGQRPRRTGDMIASIILLAVGGISLLLAVVNALTLTYQMDALYEQYGVSGHYEAGSAAAIASAVIIISHLVLYGVAVGVTIGLIRKRRVSFWMPLAAGVLASIIFFAAIIMLIVADPALMDAVMQQSQR